MPRDGIGLTFLGAAGNVTGSRYLLEVNGLRLLIDCGLFQEWKLKERNWDSLGLAAEKIDAVLLTHAHLDHCGWLPRLVKQGFRGPIYCTSATSDIAGIILMDSARLQEEDAEFKRRRHLREGRRGPHPELPLYTTDDARACLPLLSRVPYGSSVVLGKKTTATFYDAGHILGAAMLLVHTRIGGYTRSLLFSGDIGRWGAPIVRDPHVFKDASYVLVESTYGDRIHPPREESIERLAELTRSTIAAGGNMVVPSFALERAQDLLYYLSELMAAGRIPKIKVYLDSPMAVSVTRVFQNHPELHDAEMRKVQRSGREVFEFPGLHMVESAEDSKAINNVSGAMIIAGSGMCSGGRIKHHLVANINRPESTILFVGYQARGTLGRQILGRNGDVRILGQYYPVKARVEEISGFSAHADQNELLRWLGGIQSAPRHVFVVHGEVESARHFAGLVGERTAWPVSVPGYLDQVLLD